MSDLDDLAAYLVYLRGEAKNIEHIQEVKDHIRNLERYMRAIEDARRPEIDYEELVEAAKAKGYRQGTARCVAFAEGAEWQAMARVRAAVKGKT